MNRKFKVNETVRISKDCINVEFCDLLAQVLTVDPNDELLTYYLVFQDGTRNWFNESELIKI